MSFGAAAQNLSNPNTSDVEVVNAPVDSVSSLIFSPSPSPNILVSTSWDGMVCVIVQGDEKLRLDMCTGALEPVNFTCAISVIFS